MSQDVQDACDYPPQYPLLEDKGSPCHCMESIIFSKVDLCTAQSQQPVSIIWVPCKIPYIFIKAIS